MQIPEQYVKNLFRTGVTLLVILCVFFGVKTLAELRSYGMMGSDGANTITLSGHGEVSAVPDIATIYFNITKEAKTVKEAQDTVAAVEKSALDSLKANGVAEKDIQASNASFNPKYKFVYDAATSVPCNEFSCPPRSGNNVIVGYEASESITVKVRNTDSAGKVMQGLGSLGVTNLSGPNFAIDDEDALKAQARKEAIDEARNKAKILARDLGVRLGRVVTFSESGNYIPVYYDKALSSEARAGSAPAVLPKGENTISSDVSITYEIR